MKRLQIYNDYSVRNGHSPAVKLHVLVLQLRKQRPWPLAKPNGFIPGWGSFIMTGALHGVIPVRLPGPCYLPYARAPPPPPCRAERAVQGGNVVLEAKARRGGELPIMYTCMIQLKARVPGALSVLCTQHGAVS